MGSGNGGLRVDGPPACRIGDLAPAHGIALDELHAGGAWLQDAVMELTVGSVEYQAQPAAAEGA